MHTHQTPTAQAVRDTKAAVRWLKVNAAAYNVDPRKIALFGESAGACSGMAVAMTFEEDYKAELTLQQDPTLASTHLSSSSSVGCVLDHWGSDDIATQLTRRDRKPRYTTANAPVAMFHGTADTLVPFENALQIDSGYNTTGVRLCDVACGAWRAACGVRHVACGLRHVACGGQY